MFDNNWKDTFENRILRRGLLYWRDGKVMNLTKSDKKVTALVKGTSNYFVEIDFDGGTPVEMYCTSISVSFICLVVCKYVIV